MSGESRNPCNFGTGITAQSQAPTPVAAPASPSSPLALWLAIPAASYGTLCRLAVFQEAGNLDGFTVEVFNSVRAQSLGAGAIEHYRITPLLTAAGSASFVQSFNQYPYCCADGNNYNRTTTLYIRILPVTNNLNKTFSVSLTVE